MTTDINLLGWIRYRRGADEGTQAEPEREGAFSQRVCHQ